MNHARCGHELRSEIWADEHGNPVHVRVSREIPDEVLRARLPWEYPTGWRQPVQLDLFWKEKTANGQKMLDRKVAR